MNIYIFVLCAKFKTPQAVAEIAAAAHIIMTNIMMRIVIKMRLVRTWQKGKARCILAKKTFGN